MKGLLDETNAAREGVRLACYTNQTSLVHDGYNIRTCGRIIGEKQDLQVGSRVTIGICVGRL